jgi:hypothetical protein
MVEYRRQGTINEFWYGGILENIHLEDQKGDERASLGWILET